MRALQAFGDAGGSYHGLRHRVVSCEARQISTGHHREENSKRWPEGDIRIRNPSLLGTGGKSEFIEMVKNPAEAVLGPGETRGAATEAVHSPGAVRCAGRANSRALLYKDVRCGLYGLVG
jgi:hypothetical protein